MQVSLSVFQHVLLERRRAAAGQRAARRAASAVMAYLLWDWFDGGAVRVVEGALSDASRVDEPARADYRPLRERAVWRRSSVCAAALITAACGG